MSFSKVYSAQPYFLKGKIVTVEVDLAKGLHSFSVVGLPDKAVEEARDRISAAIKNTGFTSPKQKNQKVTVSLAPADLKKEGAIFDLPMALAYLKASEEVKFDPAGKLFIGELALNGELRPIRGALLLVQEAKKKGFREVFLPKENAREGALVRGIKIFGVSTLNEALKHLQGGEEVIAVEPETEVGEQNAAAQFDLSDIKGQETGKRGLLIAAAGGHNLSLYGPPGTGKTMLARALPGLLPPLSFDECLEVTAIHSIAGTLEDALVTIPPYRSPHHTSSYVALVGGGNFPKPGEVTLSHKGVLFLDEFPEFDRRVIEALRQPLEDKVVSVSRARGSAIFPASFILVTAMNPCPCGNFGSKDKRCVCIPSHLERYRRKISGPIADRIDMWIEIPRMDPGKLLGNDGEVGRGETSNEVRKKIIAARQLQEKRLAGTGIRLNGEMGAKHLEKFVKLDPKVKSYLDAAASKFDLSGRAYHRTIKLARTIADLEGRDEISLDNVSEAISFRPKQISE